MHNKNSNNEPLFDNNTVETSEQNSIVHQKALDILQKGNPVDYFMQEYGKIHVGDEDLGELLFMTVGCQLCSNTEGLQPDLSGESGKGKSDACKAVGHLLPQEYFITGSHSTLGLFHRDDILAGAIIFLDDVEKFGDKEEQLIKTITSQYQYPYEHTYTDMRKSGANKAQTVSIPSRVTFWITSVSSSFDPQILNRCLKVNVDEGKEQDKAVYQQQQEYAKTGIPRYAVTLQVEISRGMIRILKSEDPKNVIIPYIELIEWEGISNRRNYPMFLDMIRASAAINQYQRVHLPDGSIIADLSDYDRATRLWSKIERAQTTGLTDKEQVVLIAIKESGIAGITQTELTSTCSLNKTAISRAIHGIPQCNGGGYKGGLMNKLKGGLSYEGITRTYRYDGVATEDENTVSLKKRQEAENLIESYTRLHTVANPPQPISST